MKVSNRTGVVLVAALAFWSCEAEKRSLGGEELPDASAADASVDDSPGPGGTGDAAATDDGVGPAETDEDGKTDESSTTDDSNAPSGGDGGLGTTDDPGATDDGPGPRDAGPPDEPGSDAGPSVIQSCARDAECDDGNVCNGDELCIEGECHSASRVDDGTVCTIEGRDEWLHCVAGNCIASVCGDGLVDPRGDERCDDGNAIDGDGCEVGCMLSCETAEHCDDGNVCNGAESCNTDTHVCQAGQPAADQTSCGTDLECNDGRCLPVGCGDGTQSSTEQCDDGNLDDGDGCDSDCTYSCEVDADCDDASVCTGTETCDVSTHRCVAGEGLACDDDIPCTDNACDPVSGCFYPLIDVDGDGHASDQLGACGDDCDDDNSKVYTGAAELCDGLDNDCNGKTDDNSPVWYPDCDGDGFAEQGATGVTQCDMPTSSPSGCDRGLVGTWTEVKPTGGYDDCYDSNADARPRLTQTENDKSWSTSGDLSRPTGARFDYNCDDVEEKHYTAVNMDPNAGCGIIFIPPPVIGPVTTLQAQGVFAPIILDEQDCLGARGWTGSTVPACGSSAEFTYCSKYGDDGTCARRKKSSAQECR